MSQTRASSPPQRHGGMDEELTPFKVRNEQPSAHLWGSERLPAAPTASTASPELSSFLLPGTHRLVLRQLMGPWGSTHIPSPDSSIRLPSDTGSKETEGNTTGWVHCTSRAGAKRNQRGRGKTEEFLLKETAPWKRGSPPPRGAPCSFGSRAPLRRVPGSALGSSVALPGSLTGSARPLLPSSHRPGPGLQATECRVGTQTDRGTPAPSPRLFPAPSPPTQ